MVEEQSEWRLRGIRDNTVYMVYSLRYRGVYLLYDGKKSKKRK